MKLLAIESSGLVASAAIASETALLAEYTVNFKKTHSQTLLPMIEEIVKMLELDLQELDAIAVSGGPGSFTANLYGSAALICPLMDARRNQVYAGLYHYYGDSFEIVEDQMAISAEELISKVNKLGEPVLYLGDGAEAFKELLSEKTEVPCSFAPLHLSKQRAGALAARAVELYKEGRIQTAAEHAPDYLRLSQAERELAIKQAAQKTSEL